MKIEVITIGDELLSGTIADTNFQWIGDRLWGDGFSLIWHMTVADDPERIQEALLLSSDRSDVVIVTGGLGPTTDDITLEVAARAFGKPLVLSVEALREIEGMFERLGRTMTPNNRKQAMLPEGGEKISNNFGTAPGCRVRYGKAEFFFLPGVPREMKRQFEEAVLPFLKRRVPGSFFQSRLFRCFGLPEATLDQELRGAALEGVRLAWRLSFPEVFIKISTDDPGTGPMAMGKAEEEIRRRVGNHIYAEGEESIERLIYHLLSGRRETLSVAESCTGGMIADLLTNVPGISNCFDRGVIAYSNRSKEQLLGIPSKLIQEKGAVSSNVAVAMAEGIRKGSGTTYGIGVTGIAGPGGGTADRPVGTVHIAVAGPDQTTEKGYLFSRDRETFKLMSAHVALHKLRRMIQEL